MDTLENFLNKNVKKGDNMSVKKKSKVEKKKVEKVKDEKVKETKEDKKTVNKNYKYLKDEPYYAIVTVMIDKSPVNLNDSSGNISLNKRVPIFLMKGKPKEYPGMSQNAVKNSIMRAFVKENAELLRNEEDRYRSIPELIKIVSDELGNSKDLKKKLTNIIEEYPAIDLNGYLFTISNPISKDSTFNTSVLAPRVFMIRGVSTVNVRQYTDIHISLTSDNPMPFYIEEVSGIYQFYMTIRPSLIGMIPPLSSNDSIDYIDNTERFERFKGLLKTLISKWFIDEFGKSKTTIRVLQVVISNIPLSDKTHDPVELLYSRLKENDSEKDSEESRISALIFNTDEFIEYINDNFESLDYFRDISKEDSSIKNYGDLISKIEKLSEKKSNYNIVIGKLTYTQKDIDLLNTWLENEKLSNGEDTNQQ